MNRRAFLGIAAAGVAGVALPARAHSADTLARALARPRLLGIIHDDELVRTLGERYRATAPSEDNATLLCAAITGGDFGTALADAPPEAVRVHVDHQVQRDFMAAETVTLDGWILSRTEARQCALFSLLPA